MRAMDVRSVPAPAVDNADPWTISTQCFTTPAVLIIKIGDARGHRLRCFLVITSHLSSHVLVSSS